MYRKGVRGGIQALEGDELLFSKQGTARVYIVSGKKTLKAGREFGSRGKNGPQGRCLCEPTTITGIRLRKQTKDTSVPPKENPAGREFVAELLGRKEGKRLLQKRASKRSGGRIPWRTSRRHSQGGFRKKVAAGKEVGRSGRLPPLPPLGKEELAGSMIFENAPKIGKPGSRRGK